MNTTPQPEPNQSVGEGEHGDQNKLADSSARDKSQPGDGDTGDGDTGDADTGNADTGNGDGGNGDGGNGDGGNGDGGNGDGGNGDGPKAFDNPYFVLAILFLALGAAGLPILNRSNAFSAKTKKWLTLMVVLYTAIVLILLIAIVIGFIAVVIWMLNP